MKKLKDPATNKHSIFKAMSIYNEGIGMLTNFYRITIIDKQKTSNFYSNVSILNVFKVKIINYLLDVTSS